LTAALLLPAAPAGADVASLYSPTPLNAWGQDGVAYAVKLVNGLAYVGGNFNNAKRFNVLQERKYLMALDPSQPVGSMSFVTSFAPSVNGTVRAIASDATGNIYIGGDFTAPGTRVAKLNPSGQVVGGFSVSANKPVRDLLVVGNTLYLVGDFTTINGTARKRAAAVDATTGVLNGTFDPNLNGKAYAVASNNDGSHLYVGGNFTTIKGAPRSYLSELSLVDGSAVGAEFVGVGDLILDLSVKDDDSGTRLYGAGGGGFNTVVGWRTDNRTRAWFFRADGDVQAVKYSEGNVYFGFHDGFNKIANLRLLAVDDALGVVLMPEFQPTSGGVQGVLGLDANGTYLVSVGKFP
jgi:hypothetical protein